MLCLMDLIALCFYRKHVDWRRISLLIPGTLIGVILASALFVSDSAAVSVSDRVLKMLIGSLGVIFVIHFVLKKWIFKHLHTSEPN